jgi:hypothetical protein
MHLSVARIISIDMENKIFVFRICLPRRFISPAYRFGDRKISALKKTISLAASFSLSNAKQNKRASEKLYFFLVDRLF